MLANIKNEISAVFDTIGSINYRVVTATGAHDDVNINNAIKELNPDRSNKMGIGGVVFLPPGTYDISDTVVLTPSIAIIGAGHEATLLKVNKKVDAFRLISTDASDGNIVLKNFWIMGNTDAHVNPVYSSTITSVSGNVICDNTLTFANDSLNNTALEIFTWDERAQVIPIIGNTGRYIKLAYAPRVIPKSGTGYKIIANGIGLYGDGGSHSTIEDVYVMQLPGCGIVLSDGGQTVITNCYIAGNRTDSIRISPKRENIGCPSISNCMLNGGYGSAIRVDGTSYYLRATNNTMFGCKVLSTAVKAFNLHRSIISNNILPTIGTITVNVKGTVKSATPNSITLAEDISYSPYAYIGEVITIADKQSRLITDTYQDDEKKVVFKFEHETLTDVNPGDPVIVHRWPRGGIDLEGNSSDNVISTNIFETTEPFNVEPIYLGSKTNNNKVLDNFAKVLNFSKTNIVR
jgi:hypothetical protein